MAREPGKLLDYATFAKHKNNFEWVKGMYRDGAADKEVAERIGVSLPTITNWKAQHPEFAAVCDEGKEAADYAVEAALYKKAVGFNYVEKKIIKKNGEIVQEEIFQKAALPDATACAVWLNNRRPDKWKRDNARSTALEEQASITVNVINAKEQGTKNKIKANSDKQHERQGIKRAVEKNGNKN